MRALRMPEEYAEDLCAEAQRLRQDVFGDTVFLYGFIYASTYCRNSCLFCNSRLENSELQRYRKNPAEVLELAEAAAQSGVHLLDITSGEDPGFTGGDAGSLFRAVRKRTGLPIMASLGLADGAMAEALRDADWYACYQETHNRQLFARMRPGQDYDRRLNSKVAARRNGLLVEEGIMTGIGETDDDIADSIEAMAELDADQVRVMSHVPQPGSALAGLAPPPSIRERVIIAILRLSFPDRLIPASLDVAGLAGLCERLDAGANVVTSIIPPGSGLAGVANRSLDIENGGRTIRAVRSVLAECGLRAAGQDEYRDWIRNRKAGRS
jgi:methylornithine synthase